MSVDGGAVWRIHRLEDFKAIGNPDHARLRHNALLKVSLSWYHLHITKYSG